MPPLVIAAIISAVASLGSVGIGAASQSAAGKTQCERDCKNTCKAETGWLFSGRQKCIKACKADCAAQDNQPPPPAPSFLDSINWWYVTAGGLVITAILLLLFRRKIAKK